ncbi:class I SAM-dependent methyltransferase [Pectobacterium carotovorum]|uniref:class I SAM-dependent methyltransferase n=1 Tax=Pectobacterium carotovorum TaxID=554 RepID=UPI001BE4481C|nr:class I SAM-dependent methyltransferase [Pectobacterium carotovorum]
MSNKDIFGYYDNLAKNIRSPIELRNRAKDSSDYDVAFIRGFSSKEYSLLDLGSGTGLLVNALSNDFGSILAVEKYKEFSNFIISKKNVKIVNADILQFSSLEKFDVISMFGVIPYFSRDETEFIYKKIAVELCKNKDTKVIIKHQMGLDDDVIINGWSNELQAKYYSEFRSVDKEIDLLSHVGFKYIEKIDIYPSEFNRWENTHFYALVCGF